MRFPMLGARLAGVDQPAGALQIAALLVVRDGVKQVVAHVFKNRFDRVAAIKQQRALGCSALSCLARLAVCAKPSTLLYRRAAHSKLR